MTCCAPIADFLSLLVTAKTYLIAAALGKYTALHDYIAGNSKRISLTEKVSSLDVSAKNNMLMGVQQS